MSGNSLTHLNLEKHRLTKLKVLEARENLLKTLPKSLSRLVDLLRVDIGQNDMMEIPEVVGHLVNINELWIDSNNLVSVPHVSYPFASIEPVCSFHHVVYWEFEAIKLLGVDKKHDR